MANDFFDSGDYTALVAHTLARGASVNAIFAAVTVGFDRLPAMLLLNEDRVTYATEGGSSAADVYVFTLPETLVAYVEGLEVTIKSAYANTGPATINIDARGAKTIKTGAGSALVGGEILAGAPTKLCYDGTDFRIMTGAASVTDLSAHAALTAAHGATGAVVGTTNSQTLTNKTIAFGSNTISATLAQLNSAVSDADVASLAGAETLTNKTITAGILTGDTTLPGSGQLSSAGFLGLGMTPVSILDITESSAGAASINVLNANAGVAAHARVLLSNGTANGGIAHFGASFTTSNANRQDGTQVFAAGAGGLTLNTSVDQPIYLAVNDTEAGRIVSTNGGTLLLGLTAASGTSKLQVSQADASEVSASFTSAHATPATARVLDLNFTASPDNNTASFLHCTDGTTTRARIYSDGDVQNHDNSYGAISDEKLKQDVVDYDTASQWEDFKAIRLRNYRFISDVESKGDANAKEQLGVIAQELEAIMPGLVRDYPDTEEVELEPARVVTRKVMREKFETVTIEAEEFTEVDGKMAVAIVQRQEVRPVTETFQVVDGQGRPVMELVKEAKPQVRDPRTGAVIVPAVPAVMRQRVVTRPVMEEVDEEVVIPAKRGTRLTGTSTKGVLYSVLNLKTIAIVQELMRRVEALEAKVGL